MQPQPSSLRPRGPGPVLLPQTQGSSPRPPPSDPGVQTPALLPQTQGSSPSPPPSDPGVQTPDLLSQTQGSRSQTSSLRPRGPGPALLPQTQGSRPSSPPSHPGVQVQAPASSLTPRSPDFPPCPVLVPTLVSLFLLLPDSGLPPSQPHPLGIPASPLPEPLPSALLVFMAITGF
jgi:hypothetical protein